MTQQADWIKEREAIRRRVEAATPGLWTPPEKQHAANAEMLAHAPADLRRLLAKSEEDGRHMEQAAKEAGEFAEKCYVEQSRLQSELALREHRIEEMFVVENNIAVTLDCQREDIEQKVAALRKANEESVEAALVELREMFPGGCPYIIAHDYTAAGKGIDITVCAGGVGLVRGAKSVSNAMEKARKEAAKIKMFEAARQGRAIRAKLKS